MVICGSELRVWALGMLQVSAVALWCQEAVAQMNADLPATAFFLENRPADFASRLPPTGREIIVAKVRVVGDLIYLVGRDQSGQRPPAPKYRFLARVEIVDVLEGRAGTGARYDVYFAGPSEKGQRVIYPHPPSERTRDYFITSYVDEDDMRRLLGFPISEQEYEKWNERVWDYERDRSRPGARDR